jgi:hypothetical protein
MIIAIAVLKLIKVESKKGTSSHPKLDIKDALNPAATPPHLDMASNRENILPLCCRSIWLAKA